MPEGDTIHNAALRLGDALTGRTISRFTSTVRSIAGARLVGQRVTSVTARGKWLSIHLDDGRVLLSHMRMTGAWHVYREGERWRRPRSTARVVMQIDAAQSEARLFAVCFAAPVVRLVTERGNAETLAHLGPDVVAGDFDVSLALARLRALNVARPIGEALLDQRAFAGIGNIYKSETLFAERIDPFARVADLDDPTLLRILGRARALMQRNVGAARGRTTTAGFATARYAVYKRARRPCPRCGYPIVRTVQGIERRSTYYCSRCQATSCSRANADAPDARR
jgi:endonuclease-8